MRKLARFHELDLLRFLAAMAVVLFHYTFLNATELKNIATFPVLSQVFKYGYLGVELFFMISGFVILLTASKKDWRGFIISRVARLFPVFWVAVTLTTLLLVFFGSEFMTPNFSQYLWNLTMLGNYIGVENIDPVYWTLQVELKFYFWILLILLFNKIEHIEAFIFIWLMLGVLEIFHVMHGISHVLLMPEWASYFSAGALLYRIHIKGLSMTRLLMLVLAYCLSVYFAIEGANERSQLYSLQFSPWVIAGLISLFYLLFILIVSGKTAGFYRSWFMTVGVVTYPLYLIHQKLGQIVFNIAGTGVINKYLLLLLVTSSMVLLAYLLHHYLEIGFAKKMKKTLEDRLVGNNKNMRSRQESNL